jgi:hypothetical protein
MLSNSIYHQKEKWILTWNTIENKHAIRHQIWFNSEEEAKEEAKARELILREKLDKKS